MAKKNRGGAANPDLAELEKAWGLSIDPELLVLALTHRSFANEMGGLPNNERLEFLGDSVLSIVVTDKLYRTHPDAPESELADLRAAIVSQKPLAGVARTLDLGSYILLGVGENKTGGRDKDSILSDTLEALIGATYLSHGIEKTRAVLLERLKDTISAAGSWQAIQDWKTLLRAHAHQHELEEPSFEVEGSGPDHHRRFAAVTMIGDKRVASGEGPSRKEAENDAARAAYLELTGGILPDGSRYQADA